MGTKELVNRNEELENQVYNLTLYLRHVEKEHPDIIHAMRVMYDGLPGYAPIE